jgi:hypothetical protein
MVGTDRMHRLIPVAALALAGGTQDRCRGKSLVMAPTTQRTIVVGHVTAPAGLRLIPRRGAAASRRRKVGAGRGGSLARRRRSPLADRGDPPYDARDRDSLNQSHATGSDFSRLPPVRAESGG